MGAWKRSKVLCKAVYSKSLLRIDELAFEIREALLDQRCFDLLTLTGRQVEARKFPDVAARAVADANDLGREIVGRDVDHAFAAFMDHLEAVVLIPDVAADEGGIEAHHHVPAHGHDVGLNAIGGAHENDRAGFKETPERVDRKILFAGGFHVGIARVACGAGGWKSDLAHGVPQKAISCIGLASVGTMPHP
jgi:hypothetical protein